MVIWTGTVLNHMKLALFLGQKLLIRGTLIGFNWKVTFYVLDQVTWCELLSFPDYTVRIKPTASSHELQSLFLCEQFVFVVYALCFRQGDDHLQWKYVEFPIVHILNGKITHIDGLRVTWIHQAALIHRLKRNIHALMWF
jgi:hypothetical protein